MAAKCYKSLDTNFKVGSNKIQFLLALFIILVGLKQTIFFRRYLSSLFCLLCFFMLYKELSIFKFFLKMVNFFPKKPKFEQLTCLTLDSFIFRSLKDFIFLSKTRGNIYWSMELSNINHWKFELCIS